MERVYWQTKFQTHLYIKKHLINYQLNICRLKAAAFLRWPTASTICQSSRKSPSPCCDVNNLKSDPGISEPTPEVHSVLCFVCLSVNSSSRPYTNIYYQLSFKNNIICKYRNYKYIHSYVTEYVKSCVRMDAVLLCSKQTIA